MQVWIPKTALQTEKFNGLQILLSLLIIVQTSSSNGKCLHARSLVEHDSNGPKSNEQWSLEINRKGFSATYHHPCGPVIQTTSVIPSHVPWRNGQSHQTSRVHRQLGRTCSAVSVNHSVQPSTASVHTENCNNTNGTPHNQAEGLQNIARRALPACTTAVQPTAACRQSPYLHNPAIVIVTSFSSWRLMLVALAAPVLIMTSFSLWHHSLLSCRDVTRLGLGGLKPPPHDVAAPPNGDGNTSFLHCCFGHHAPIIEGLLVGDSKNVQMIVMLLPTTCN